MPILKNKFNNYMFKVDDIKIAVHLWEDLNLVYTKDNKAYVIAPYNYIGKVGDYYINKGRFSNSYIELSDIQVKKIQSIHKEHIAKIDITTEYESELMADTSNYDGEWQPYKSSNRYQQ